MDRFLLSDYRARINRVQDYIERRLAHEFSLKELADIAHFSKYHFHRIFHSLVGETLFQFIQRLRIEKAATLLLYHPNKSITSIAMDCGFSSPAVFARVFKEYFGVPARGWRSLEGRTEEVMKKVHRHEQRMMEAAGGRENQVTPESVSVMEADAVPVVYIRYVGPFQGDQELFDRLYHRLFTWAGARDLYTPGENRVFSLTHDNPVLTEDTRLRISCCISVPGGTVPEGEIGYMVLPPGKYACAEFYLDVHEYGWAWAAVFREWLPVSGYEPDDRPAFEEYLDTRGSRHPEKHHVLIWLPVRPS